MWACVAVGLWGWCGWLTVAGVVGACVAVGLCGAGVSG